MWIGNVEEYILFEDKEVIVCHKPAGIAVQNARVGTMDLESALKNYLMSARTKNTGATQHAGALQSMDCAQRTAPYLGVVHRLDQPVEGVLVFAKTPRSSRELSRQMAAGEMGKIYMAVTAEKPRLSQGILEDYLKKDGRANSSAVVKAGTPGAKKARLQYKVIGESVADWQTEGGTGSRSLYLIQIQLETGRHHQIRVQMANAGMPLLGDYKYNPEVNDGVPLALCSCRLSFQHPVRKKKMEFSVLPKGAAFDVFGAVLKELEE